MGVGGPGPVGQRCQEQSTSEDVTHLGPSWTRCKRSVPEIGVSVILQGLVIDESLIIGESVYILCSREIAVGGGNERPHAVRSEIKVDSQVILSMQAT